MARPRSDIRSRLVHAAREQFLKSGVEGARLRTIARQAKTSIGMVYYYFPSKDDLFFAVVEEVYAALLFDVTEALAPDAQAGERLRRMYVRIGAVTDLELAIVRLVMREALASSTRLERVIRRFQRGHVPLVLAAVSDGIREGSIDARWSPGLAFICALALGGAAQLLRKVAGDRLGLGDLPTGAALSEDLVNVLFGGIGAKAPPARRAPTATRR